MTRQTPVDRAAIAADLEWRRVSLHKLVEGAGDDDLDRLSTGTRWTNEQLLFHMVFGYMVVRRLLVVIWVFSRLPESVSRLFARALNATTPVFDEVNYRGSCLAARVFDRQRMGRQCDRVIASLEHRLWNESEADLRRGMHFPTRWDPFFADYMTLEQVYRYPGEHFDFHRRQLALG
ncbi:DinB family protein [Rhodococcus sp. OK611]|uniref:DinB family protein n=1 Tax=Rhodococcus TaxID=1827 RepID=UPI000BCEAB50|nr:MULTISPECIES: DinB family protein [Rhodococcus]MCZ4558592.1 DinB family protein [Rhodococcus maanshanensis]PTR38978.1 DinB family protein [Rhodococcus sp. OK611]SNX92764.1 DinB superfamily protein [Rhodococcus sp. OK270]